VGFLSLWIAGKADLQEPPIPLVLDSVLHLNRYSTCGPIVRITDDARRIIVSRFASNSLSTGSVPITLCERFGTLGTSDLNPQLSVPKVASIHLSPPVILRRADRSVAPSIPAADF
jgi:hypothetical protein